MNTNVKTNTAPPITVPSAAVPKRNSAKAHSAVNVPIFNKADIVPVIVPRTNTRVEQAAESRKEFGIAARTMPFSLQSKTAELRRFSNSRDDMDQPTISTPSENMSFKTTDSSSNADGNIFVAKGSTDGLSINERNFKDDRSAELGRHYSNSMREPPVFNDPDIQICEHYILQGYNFSFLSCMRMISKTTI